MKKTLTIFIIFIITSARLLAATTNTSFVIENDKAGSRETALGCIVTDAMRIYSKADIAFVLASDLKKITPINAGEVDSTQITAALAYPNDTISTIKLTGTQIINALNKSLFIYPNSYMGFMQISGISVTFNPQKSVRDKVVDIKIKKENIDPEHIYTVAMPTSLANGAGGYWKIWGKDIEKQQFEEISVAIEKYFEKTEKITYLPNTRIIQDKKK